VERIQALAPGGVNAVVDCAGGALGDLVTIAENPRTSSSTTRQADSWYSRSAR
jgi:hypothetical protein